MSETKTLDAISQYIANAMKQRYGGAHSGVVTAFHSRLAKSILEKDAYYLREVLHKGNSIAMEVFSWATGLKLPTTDRGIWEVVRQWAGISPEAHAVWEANRKVGIESEVVKHLGYDVNDTRLQFQSLIAKGFDNLVHQTGQWLLVDSSGNAYNLSKRGTGLAKVRNLLQAELELHRATLALQQIQPSQAVAA